MFLTLVTTLPEHLPDEDGALDEALAGPAHNGVYQDLLELVGRVIAHRPRLDSFHGLLFGGTQDTQHLRNDALRLAGLRVLDEVEKINCWETRY